MKNIAFFTALIISTASVQASATGIPCPGCGGIWEMTRDQISCENGHYYVNHLTRSMRYLLPLWQDGEPLSCVEGERPDNEAVSAANKALAQHLRELAE